MPIIPKVFNECIENSTFGIFAKQDGAVKFVDTLSGKVEIDRIVESYNGRKILSLRVRNTSRLPLKIYSFIVAEFYLPEEEFPSEVMENNWLQCSAAAYKRLTDPTERNVGFFQRDQNPYSFNKDYGHIKGSVISEWFTSLKFSNGNFFIGAVTTADQFAQIFVKKEGEKVLVRVASQFDGLVLTPGQVTKSEKIFFGFGKGSEIEKQFAISLAHFMKVKKPGPPLRAICCSYYWNGNKITEEIINKELDAMGNLDQRLNIDYVQFDAGYTQYFGDWLDYKMRFPSGFSSLITKIKNMGYKAGIWLSPFAINPSTRLRDYHKRWLIHDQYKKIFEGRWTSPFDQLTDYLELDVLDPTNDEVKKYLTKVLLHFKKQGFTLFKLDFMYPVCLADRFSKPVTRAQALRQGLMHIRKVLGDECLILSGITPLSSVVGIADNVRTGIDSLNPFACAIPGVNSLVNNFMLEGNIKESSNRLFFNGIIWRADPDVLVFRKGTGLDEELINKHKKFAVSNKMSLWIGDSIAKMSDEEKVAVVAFFNNTK